MESGPVSVTVTDADGCTAEASVEVAQLDNPVAEILGDTAFCSGSSLTLSGGDFASFLWSTDEVSSTIDVMEGGNYGLTVTDDEGCTGETMVMITENELPEVNITGETTFCFGQTTELDAGSYVSYFWTTGDGTQVISLENSTTVSVTVTDENGCEGEGSIEVTEGDPLEPMIEGTLSFCNGGSTTLAAPGFATYLWSNGADEPSIDVNTAGPVGVTVTDADGCTGEASVEVTEAEMLAVEIAGELAFCANGATTLDAGTFATYLWSNGDVTQTTEVMEPGPISVTVTDAEGCSGEAMVEVTESAPIEVMISGDTEFCENGSSLLEVGDFATYLWSTDEETPSITVMTPGTYSVTVMDQIGCTGENSITISQLDNPVVQITGATGICPGGSTTLAAGDYQAYEWSNGDMTEDITVGSPGTYSVTVVDDNGCRGEASVEVTQSEDIEFMIAGATNICPGASTALDAGEFSTYEWSTDATTQTILVTEPRHLLGDRYAGRLYGRSQFGSHSE